MGPRRFGRGDIFLHPQLRVRAASMGPRPFGRGDLNSPANQQQRYRLQWGRGLSAAETSARRDGRATRKCFNGAAAFRPRRLGRRTQSPTRNPGFNGAAAFRPRRRTNKRSVRAAETLQWGRGLSAAETRPDYQKLYGDRASMGPRPFGRGDIAPRRPRGRWTASMGPRPFGRGDNSASSLQRT